MMGCLTNSRRDPRALVGVPFRLHGRDPETGLDCVGVVAWVLGAGSVPSGYRMRQAEPGRIVAGLAEAGLQRIGDADAARAGDVMLIAAGPAQYHLAVATEDSFVHACAGLRRVVETPGRPEGVIGVWRQES